MLNFVTVIAMPESLLLLLRKIGRFESAALLLWLVVWYATVGDWIPSPILVVLSCTLSGYYTLTARTSLRSEGAHAYLKILDRFIGLSSGVLILGLLFRTMLYPGWPMMLNFGMLALILQVALQGIPRVRKHTLPDRTKLTLRWVILGGVGGFYWLVFLI